ncbi:MAG: amino acid racemase, partial [Parvularculaceae bacterium]|nr:amino acid racemase [Parvularculaceae bacterium]
GAHQHPEVSLHTHALGRYAPLLDAGDWAGVGALMLSSAEKLARVGADFLICPDNTIHQALPLIRGASPLPWLHIAEVVAAEARARGFAKIGITGTAWLTAGPVYPETLAAAGLAFERPTEDERRAMGRVIMDELVRGIFRDEAVGLFQTVMTRMKSAGCDAVALGCTEIPLIMHDGNSPLPTLDSTRLLARAALKRAIG